MAVTQGQSQQCDSRDGAEGLGNSSGGREGAWDVPLTIGKMYTGSRGNWQAMTVTRPRMLAEAPTNCDGAGPPPSNFNSDIDPTRPAPTHTVKYDTGPQSRTKDLPKLHRVNMFTAKCHGWKCVSVGVTSVHQRPSSMFLLEPTRFLSMKPRPNVPWRRLVLAYRTQAKTPTQPAIVAPTMADAVLPPVLEGRVYWRRPGTGRRAMQLRLGRDGFGTRLRQGARRPFRVIESMMPMRGEGSGQEGVEESPHRRRAWAALGLLIYRRRTRGPSHRCDSAPPQRRIAMLFAPKLLPGINRASTRLPIYQRMAVRVPHQPPNLMSLAAAAHCCHRTFSPCLETGRMSKAMVYPPSRMLIAARHHLSGSWEPDRQSVGAYHPSALNVGGDD
jgi:hypothetical protein